MKQERRSPHNAVQAVGMDANDPCGIPNFWQMGERGRIFMERKDTQCQFCKKLGLNEKGGDKERHVFNIFVGIDICRKVTAFPHWKITQGLHCGADCTGCLPPWSREDRLQTTKLSDFNSVQNVKSLTFIPQLHLNTLIIKSCLSYLVQLSTSSEAPLTIISLKA